MAISKDDSKFGRIIRIDEKPDKTTKKPKQFAIIDIPRLFREDLKIPLGIEFILTIGEKAVKFDIPRKEFNELKKTISGLKHAEDEILAKTEPARFLFFSNQSAKNIPKQEGRK